MPRLTLRRARDADEAADVGCPLNGIRLRVNGEGGLTFQSTFSAVAFSYAVLLESALSFLGLGAQPPEPSWGNMINTGRGFIDQAPWISLAPGAALFVTVFSFNLLGDGLRDVLDPKLND